jgi:hypothetical protein
VSFAAITVCVASQRVFIVLSIYFVIDSVRKLVDTPSYIIIFNLCCEMFPGIKCATIYVCVRNMLLRRILTGYDELICIAVVK